MPPDAPAVVVETPPAPSSAPDAPVPSPPPSGAIPVEPPKPREVSEFARRRHALSARAKEVDARAKAAEEQVKAARAEVESAKREAAEERAKREAWEKAPLRRAREAGQDLDQVIRDGIGDQTPERVAADALAEAKAIREEISAKEAAQQKAWQEHQQRQEEQQRQEARTGFCRTVVSAKDAAGRAKYAYIHAEWDDAELARHTAIFDDWARGEGKSYTFDQVAEYLDGIAKRTYESKSERRRALEQPAPGPEDRDKPPPGRDPRGNGSAPHTTKGKAPPRALTKDEQAEEDLAILKRAMEADRVAASKR